MLRGGRYGLKTTGSFLLGTLAVIGFTGKGRPGDRRRNPKRKAKARQHRKLVRQQKQHAENV